MRSLVATLACLVSATGASLAQTVWIQGNYPQGKLGFAVDIAGDTNGDGVPDMVIGAPEEAFLDRGVVRIVSGVDGSLLHKFVGDEDRRELGYSVAGAGDVNADGYADVILGAPTKNPGRAIVRSGVDGAVLHVFTATTPNNLVGASVDGVGDVNGDGYDDVVVGDTATSSATVYSGVDGAVLHVLTGQPGSSLGYSVAGAGDVDGDGVPDIVTGEPNFDSSNGAKAGRARVFSGADGSILHKFKGPYALAQFGGAVSGAGDVDGDGCADVIVGSLNMSPREVHVYSGRTGAVLHVLTSPFVDDRLGAAVSDAGDWNGDGFADFAVGAPGHVVNLKRSGRVDVYSGADGALLARHIGRGIQLLGTSVAADGFLLAGAPAHAAATDRSPTPIAGAGLAWFEHPPRPGR